MNKVGFQINEKLKLQIHALFKNTHISLTKGEVIILLHAHIYSLKGFLYVDIVGEHIHLLQIHFELLKKRNFILTTEKMLKGKAGVRGSD